MTIGDVIHKHRIAKKMTLQDLHDLSTVSISTVWCIEKNRRSPTISTLTLIADALGVDVNTLLDEVKYSQCATDIYDQIEEHENCTVQILTNSVTGDVSVGWWEN